METAAHDRLSSISGTLVSLKTMAGIRNLEFKMGKVDVGNNRVQLSLARFQVSDFRRDEAAWGFAYGFDTTSRLRRRVSGVSAALNRSYLLNTDT